MIEKINGAIILAAGEGSRFGGKKQFLKINDKTLWEIVLNKIEKFIHRDNIIVVGVDCVGGRTRSESVRIGLNELRGNLNKVIILEAARPLITSDQIKQMLDCTSVSNSFYIDLVDTVMGKNGEYMNRDEYCNLQTPQSFDYKMLADAYKCDDFFDMTDETRVMYEFHKVKPKLIEGGVNLMKVTYKNDYDIILNMISVKE